MVILVLYVHVTVMVHCVDLLSYLLLLEVVTYCTIIEAGHNMMKSACCICIKSTYSSWN